MYAAIERNCKCFAFEPGAANYHALNRNIETNEFRDDQVLALPIALHSSDTISVLNMQRTFEGSSGSSFEKAIDAKGGVFKPIFRQGCVGIKGDTLVINYGIPSPNFLKIDVDGNEQEVLMGLSEVLKSPGLHSISVELDNNRADLIDWCKRYLETFGYSNIICEKGGGLAATSIQNFQFVRL